MCIHFYRFFSRFSHYFILEFVVGKDTIIYCIHCEAAVEVTEVKLSYTESDSIDCPKCNQTLKEWKKSAKAYFVKSN